MPETRKNTPRLRNGVMKRGTTWSYVIRVKEIEVGRGDLRPNMLLVMEPRGEQINLPGEATTEPTWAWMVCPNPGRCLRMSVAEMPRSIRCALWWYWAWIQSSRAPPSDSSAGVFNAARAVAGC